MADFVPATSVLVPAPGFIYTLYNLVNPGTSATLVNRDAGCRFTSTIPTDIERQRCANLEAVLQAETKKAQMRLGMIAVGLAAIGFFVVRKK